MLNGVSHWDRKLESLTRCKTVINFMVNSIIVWGNFLLADSLRGKCVVFFLFEEYFQRNCAPDSNGTDSILLINVLAKSDNNLKYFFILYPPLRKRITSPSLRR